MIIKPDSEISSIITMTEYKNSMLDIFTGVVSIRVGNSTCEVGCKILQGLPQQTISSCSI